MHAKEQFGVKASSCLKWSLT